MGQHEGLPDLLVVHDDAAGARRTIERLSRAGVDGGAIRLLGHVEVVTAGRYGDRQVDRGSSGALGGRLLRGIAIGGPAGALLGGILFQITSGPGAWWAGVVGGMTFGAAAGLLIGLLAAPTMAPSWERTFAPLVPGGVAVGIRGADERTLERARRVARQADARTVREVVDLDELPDGLVADLEQLPSDDTPPR